MKVLKTKAAFRAARATVGTVGLVPTMGFLHEGHLSLMRQARAENDAAAVSIFVNPTQFAPGGDFDRYPRALERDLQLMETTGVDLVFAPDAAEMYPPGFAARIEIGGVSEGLEGAARPNHFSGVATVVVKLLNITQPQQAYFGQKDAQQAAVIQKLAADLDLDVQIVIVRTVREADGLAMSSRNSYLNPAERSAAAVLFRALTAAQKDFEAGERDAQKLRCTIKSVLQKEPLAAPDYVSLADPETLKELDQVGPQGALASLAVQIGPARLIDNLRIG